MFIVITIIDYKLVKLLYRVVHLQTFEQYLARIFNFGLNWRIIKVKSSI